MAKKHQQNVSGKFIFRKHAAIGAADAIDDVKFLSQAFIDNGELGILCDMSEPKCIVTGRTGAGKTALLEQLSRTQEKVIKITPEGLALTHISNSEVLSFFIEAGVNMDLFYRLLWRHVFAVELIREHYQIINEQARDSFLIQIRDRIFRNKTRKDAIDYLVTWGESFWKESEYRVKEITETLEQNLGASLGGEAEGPAIPGLVTGSVKLNAEVAKKLSAEQKAEVVHRGQSVVDKVQMKTLSDIIELLESDILDDKKRKYYITIDRLDEDWINDHLRYQLIRALLDTMRDFNHKIQNVKILVAIREDLLARVFRYTRSPGQQEEKYKSLYLRLNWQKDGLEQLMDRRVDQLVKEQYTTQVVRLRTLLPSTLNKQNPIDYLVERTMLVPRDMIMFFNECIRSAEGQATIGKAALSQAETIYSENRLRALADEWSADYPNLIELILFMKGFPEHFRMEDVRDKIENCMLNFLISNKRQDYIHDLVEEKFDNDDIDSFMQEMFKILFQVGAIGIKQEHFTSIYWSFKAQKLITSEINETALVHIHPAFWRILGIRPPSH